MSHLLSFYLCPCAYKGDVNGILKYKSIEWKIDLTIVEVKEKRQGVWFHYICLNFRNVAVVIIIHTNEVGVQTEGKFPRILC